MENNDIISSIIVTDTLAKIKEKNQIYENFKWLMSNGFLMQMHNGSIYFLQEVPICFPNLGDLKFKFVVMLTGKGVDVTVPFESVSLAALGVYSALKQYFRKRKIRDYEEKAGTLMHQLMGHKNGWGLIGESAQKVVEDMLFQIVSDINGLI